MTIRERLERSLVLHGLWPEEASNVVRICEEAAEHKDMAGRWDHDVIRYRPALLAILWRSAKQHAVEWIDANKPKHSARAILTETAENI